MRRMMLSLLAGVVVVASGCALMAPGPDMRAAIDTQKIAQVESAAKLFGVQVYWVNFPTKWVASTN